MWFCERQGKTVTLQKNNGMLLKMELTDEKHIKLSLKVDENVHTLILFRGG